MAITPIFSSFSAVAAARPAGASTAQQVSSDLAESSLVSDASLARTTASAETQAVAASGSPSRVQIDQAMQAIKEALPPVARNLQFSIDDDTGQTVIKVMDPATKEVIRQIPSEELLAITKALDSFTGLLVKQKA